MKNSLIVLFILLFSSLHVLAAGDIESVNMDMSSSLLRKATAKQEMIDGAIEEASIRYIKELIGDEKTKRNLDVIKNRIISQSGKYVFYIRGMNLEKLKNGFKMQVSLNLSVSNLRKILLDKGLLYKIDGPPKVIPLVSFIDRKRLSTYQWWSKGRPSSFLKNQARILNNKLKAKFRVSGFFSLRPIKDKLYMRLPQVYRLENLRKEDMLFIADYNKCQIALAGSVSFFPKKNTLDKYIVGIKLSAIQTINGRTIAQIRQSFETDKGAFDFVVGKKFIQVSEQVTNELVAQVIDFWKKGTFGAHLLNISLNGNISYDHYTKLKKILARMKPIKSLKERTFAPGHISFEADVGSGANQLATFIKNREFGNYKIEVADYDANNINLKVSLK